MHLSRLIHKDIWPAVALNQNYELIEIQTKPTSNKICNCLKIQAIVMNTNYFYIANFFLISGSTAEEDIATLSKHFAEAVINVDNKSIPSKSKWNIIICRVDEGWRDTGSNSRFATLNNPSFSEYANKYCTHQESKSWFYF